MKVLVTGATGFIGRQLLLDLGERGRDIVVLTRNAQSAGARLPVSCRIHAWDSSRQPPPPEAFAGVKAVVHLTGAGVAKSRWTSARKKEIARSRILSTRNLVQAMEQLESKPEVLVSASAIGFYGQDSGTAMREDAPPGTGFLAETCREWEEEAFRAQSLGIRVVALRLAFVIGRNSVAMDRILPAFRLGLGGPLGSGKQPMSWIHVRDAAGLILHTLQTPSMKGAFNAVSPNTVSNGEFARVLGKTLRRPALLPVPAFALKIGLGEMSQLLLSSPQASAAKAAASGYRFQFPTLEGALREICGSPCREFQMEQWVPQPVDKIFSFFGDAKSLETLTPDFLAFKILGQSTQTLEEGTLIDYRIKLHGVPVRWQSRIFDWRPRSGFSDMQTKGPYADWRHTHEFIEKDGGTLIRDKAVYRLPFGVLGDTLAGPVVRKDLERIFAYRRKKIEELFGGPDRRP